MDTSELNVATPQATKEPSAEPVQIDATFTVAELCILLALRRSYTPYFDTFSEREMGHLRLYRWLYLTGNLSE
jgi:hypothetical protein